METKIYKDILWIDDMDTNDSKVAHFGSKSQPCKTNKNQYSLKWIKNYLSKDSTDYTATIILLNKMKDAFKEIANNFNQYNLVIFDMDMSQGWNNPDERIYLEEELKKYNINAIFQIDNKSANKPQAKLRDIKRSYSQIDNNKSANGTKDAISGDKIAGIYLYLLLLTKGYPADRMIIYTGNTYDKLKQNFSYLTLGKIMESKGNKLNLEKFYTQNPQNPQNSQNSYYRIRRLVQQGCHYWREEIKEKNDPQDIVFNRIYFNEEKQSSNRISVENFCELLNRIEMMFPVVPPANPEQLYYQVARIFCGYHEEKAKIQTIANKAYYPFHVVCRNFRNWSSHNKFTSVKMSDSIFAIIFCIVLRTYFDDNQSPKEQKEFFSECFYYEDIYFSKKDTSYKDIADETLNRLYEKISNWLYEKISIFQIFDNYKKNKKPLTNSHLTYIVGLGDTPREIYEILFPILMGNTKVPINLELFFSKLSEFKEADTNFSSNNENNDTDTNSSFNNDFAKLMLNKACEILEKVESLQEKSED